jgi:hypothetical protein
MVGTERTVEKRKHKRFKVQKNTYIITVNDTTNLGQMINISKGGLAFNYIGQKEKIAGWHKVDIFLSSKRFYLKEILFKATSDFYLDPNTPFSTVLMKQCGGEFGEMTDEQKSQLDYFLDNHTID